MHIPQVVNLWDWKVEVRCQYSSVHVTNMLIYCENSSSGVLVAYILAYFEANCLVSDAFQCLFSIADP